MCRRSSEQVEVERPIVVGGWLPPRLQLSTYSLPRAAADTHNIYNVQVSKYKNTRQVDRQIDRQTDLLPRTATNTRYKTYKYNNTRLTINMQTGRQTNCQHTMYMRYINIYPKTRCFFEDLSNDKETWGSAW